jgi:hypothetical protein
MSKTGDALVDALVAAFLKHDAEEWGAGPMSDFIEERLRASGIELVDEERLAAIDWDGLSRVEIPDLAPAIMAALRGADPA